jgi:hypothetical protein
MAWPGIQAEHIQVHSQAVAIIQQLAQAHLTFFHRLKLRLLKGPLLTIAQTPSSSDRDAEVQRGTKPA